MTAPQKRIAASPDRRLELINERVFRDTFGCYCLEGTVKNNDARSALDAEIKVDYYGGDKVKIDTEQISLKALPPGKARAFYLAYSGLKRGEIRYHQYHLEARA
jgi:hypothetical protein